MFRAGIDENPKQADGNLEMSGERHATFQARTRRIASTRVSNRVVRRRRFHLPVPLGSIPVTGLPLDWEMAAAGLEMVRYADDFVVLCRSEQEARQALKKIQEFAKANGLRLHPEKTQIVNAREPGGFDFLGYHFERGMKWPPKKSLAKLKQALRAKTRRTCALEKDLREML
jgi:retron-type reverse transcriptase